MPENIELLIALIVPFVALIALRINAAMVFLSICLGYVLVELVAKDANSLISFVAPEAGSLSNTTWRLGMLFVPVVLTCIIMAFSIKGRLKMIFNILPAAASAVLALLLALPLFTPGLRYALQDEAVWQQLSHAQAMIVGIGAFISLLFLWAQRRGAKKSE